MSEKNTVIVVTQNLMFLPRVEQAASLAGLTSKRSRTEPDFREALGKHTAAAVIVDLEGDQDTWVKVLEGLQAEADRDGIKVIAYGPHEDTDSMDRARALGCDMVLSKGQFNRDLQMILKDVSAGVSG